jgi:hypothetical protein
MEDQAFSSTSSSANHSSVPVDSLDITQIQSGLTQVIRCSCQHFNFHACMILYNIHHTTQLRRERALAEIQLTQERVVSLKLQENNEYVQIIISSV